MFWTQGFTLSPLASPIPFTKVDSERDFPKVSPRAVRRSHATSHVGYILYPEQKHAPHLGPPNLTSFLKTSESVHSMAWQGQPEPSHKPDKGEEVLQEPPELPPSGTSQMTGPTPSLCTKQSGIWERQIPDQGHWQALSRTPLRKHCFERSCPSKFFQVIRFLPTGLHLGTLALLHLG